MRNNTTALTPDTLNNFYNDESNQKDFQLISMLADGNEKAIDLLFDKYYSSLCQTSLRIVKDSQTAEDIVQELFLWLWKNRETLTINLSLQVYLKRAAINRSINKLRNQRTILSEEVDIQQVDEQLSAQESLEYQELSTVILEHIAALPPQCQIAFRKSRFEDMTYQQIADEMGLSIKTVGNHISKALQILRETLSPKISLMQASY